MKFYDLQKTLSYNCNINAIFGHRSIGKTYTLLLHCVNAFIKHGHTMAYVRRYDNDLKTVKPHIFDDIAGHESMAGYEFKCVGNEYYIRKQTPDEDGEWQLFCYLLALSKFQKYKSMPFPNCKNIVVEEYLIENPRLTRYLSKEIDALVSIYITIARYCNDVKMFLVSNVGDIVNPLFRWLGIDNEPKRGYTTYTLGTLEDGSTVKVLLHYVFDKVISRQTSNTVGAVIASSTDYAAVANANEFRGTEQYYIDKKTSRARVEYCLTFRGDAFTLWCDYSTLVYYITSGTVKDAHTVALTFQDFRPNMAAIDFNNKRLRMLLRLYSNGCIYFADVSTREKFLDMLRLCGIR